MTSYERQLATAVNATRQHYGLRTSSFVPGLMRSAGKHSLQMACNGYSRILTERRQLHHSRERFYGTGTASYFSAGENLFWRKPGVAEPGRQGLAGQPGASANTASAQWRVFGVGRGQLDSWPRYLRGSHGDARDRRFRRQALTAPS